MSQQGMSQRARACHSGAGRVGPRAGGEAGPAGGLEKAVEGCRTPFRGDLGEDRQGTQPEMEEAELDLQGPKVTMNRLELRCRRKRPGTEECGDTVPMSRGDSC